MYHVFQYQLFDRISRIKQEPKATYTSWALQTLFVGLMPGQCWPALACHQVNTQYLWHPHPSPDWEISRRCCSIYHSQSGILFVYSTAVGSCFCSWRKVDVDIGCRWEGHNKNIPTQAGNMLQRPFVSHLEPPWYQLLKIPRSH